MHTSNIYKNNNIGFLFFSFQFIHAFRYEYQCIETCMFKKKKKCSPKSPKTFYFLQFLGRTCVPALPFTSMAKQTRTVWVDYPKLRVPDVLATCTVGKFRAEDVIVVFRSQGNSSSMLTFTCLFYIYNLSSLSRTHYSLVSFQQNNSNVISSGTEKGGPCTF